MGDHQLLKLRTVWSGLRGRGVQTGDRLLLCAGKAWRVVIDPPSTAFRRARLVSVGMSGGGMGTARRMGLAVTVEPNDLVQIDDATVYVVVAESTAGGWGIRLKEN